MATTQFGIEDVVGFSPQLQVTMYNTYYACQIIQRAFRKQQGVGLVEGSMLNHGSFDDHEFWSELTRKHLSKKDKLELFDRLGRRY